MKYLTSYPFWKSDFLLGLNGLAVLLVADFEALSCQVTITFDTGCAARIRTAPAINYYGLVLAFLS